MQLEFCLIREAKPAHIIMHGRLQMNEEGYGATWAALPGELRVLAAHPPSISPSHPGCLVGPIPSSASLGTAALFWSQWEETGRQRGGSCGGSDRANCTLATCKSPSCLPDRFTIEETHPRSKRLVKELDFFLFPLVFHSCWKTTLTRL